LLEGGAEFVVADEGGDFVSDGLGSGADGEDIEHGAAHLGADEGFSLLEEGERHLVVTTGGFGVGAGEPEARVVVLRLVGGDVFGGFVELAAGDGDAAGTSSVAGRIRCIGAVCSVRASSKSSWAWSICPAASAGTQC
jgi:hypothetical protein